MIRSKCASAALLLAILCGGCFGPKIVREPIYTSESLRVQLRRTLERGQPVARGYAHPATISDVRFAHILANLEYSDKEGKRQPAIASEIVYELAEGLNKAVLKAGADDEVAAVAFQETRRLGLFSNRRVTSFRMFFTSSDLVFEFYDIGRQLEPGEGRTAQGQDYEIPIGAPAATSAVRLLAGRGLSTEGPRTVRVDWRDEYFAQPVKLSVRDGGFKRRTVISEAPPGAVPEPAPPPLATSDPALRDGQLRALDQLDAARRSGLVTEAEFQKRRRLILEGKLAEAGYDSAAPSSP